LQKSARWDEDVKIVNEVDALLERLNLSGNEFENLKDVKYEMEEQRSEILDRFQSQPLERDAEDNGASVENDQLVQEKDAVENSFLAEEDTFQQISLNPDQLEYRSVYGDPRVVKKKSSVSSSVVHQSGFFSDASGDFSFSAETDDDESVREGRSARNQRDIALASVDPNTARKCLMVGAWGMISNFTFE
jgi:hypothetical protein